MAEVKSVGRRIRDGGLRLGMKAVSRLMEDPDRAQVVMDAVQGVRAGREGMDEVTGKLRNLADLPSRADLRDLGKLLGKLRRDVKRLKGRLEDLAERV
jgi:beta-phosphoglucomutase-like phosphatase (HAD superfamily)